MSTILKLRRAETSVRGNSPKCKMFPLFPGNGNGSIRAITAGMLRHGEGLAICPCTRRRSPGLYSAGFEDPASGRSKSTLGMFRAA